MRLFKRSLRTRLKALENYLGVSFVIDRWDDPEVIDNEYALLKTMNRRIRRIEKKVFTPKELKDSRYDYDD